jgi:hypothetical protein
LLRGGGGAAKQFSDLFTDPFCRQPQRLIYMDVALRKD